MGQLDPANGGSLARSWTASLGAASTISTPLVASGTVVVATGQRLWAFSAAGSTGCAGVPVSCSSLRVGTGGEDAIVVNGHLHSLVGALDQITIVTEAIPAG